MLPPAKPNKWQATKEYAFYNLIFCRINEQPFSVLYSDKKSRPNTPINVIVGAMILKEHRDWSYEELLGQVEFDLRTRVALGLSDFDRMPFCETTLFNFQNRLAAHYLETGEDLLAQVYHQLHHRLAPAYSEAAIFKIFDRVYTEHFTVIEDRIEIKPNEELTSDSRQSPDATYRQKRDQKSQGQTIHVTETAHPDNKLNLLTDVVVVTNAKFSRTAPSCRLKLFVSSSQR